MTPAVNSKNTRNDESKSIPSSSDPSSSSSFALVPSPTCSSNNNSSSAPVCWQRPSWLYYPGLDAAPWHSLSQSAHSWTQLLTDNFDGIKAEFNALRQKRFESFDTITNTVAAGGRWNTYYLIQQGIRASIPSHSSYGSISESHVPA
jgi:hypothetical protein